MVSNIPEILLFVKYFWEEISRDEGGGFWILNESSLRPAKNPRVATPSLCEMTPLLVRHSRPKGIPSGNASIGNPWFGIDVC